jgi:hypothetical protein
MCVCAGQWKSLDFIEVYGWSRIAKQLMRIPPDLRPLVGELGFRRKKPLKTRGAAPAKVYGASEFELGGPEKKGRSLRT